MSSQLSWNIIKHFSVRKLYGFRFQDVVREFPEKHRVYLARILADMVDKGMLYKLTRDLYHIIPFNADPETYVPDSYQVAKYIMQPQEYYIGYASAMRIHGLTIQSEPTESEHTESKPTGSEPTEPKHTESKPTESKPTGFEPTGSKPHEYDPTEYVVTKNQMKPATRILQGITYKFIQHNTTRFFGYSSTWINQLEEAPVSDLEKTIVDIAAKPAYCGGISEVAHALSLAKERADHDKLFYYFARNMNKSAKKRFLFLTDLLGLEWTGDHERMMKELGTGSSLLDPSAPNQGKNSRKFGLKINVDPSHIKKKVLHP